jgi:hypothetical protein
MVKIKIKKADDTPVPIVAKAAPKARKIKAPKPPPKPAAVSSNWKKLKEKVPGKRSAGVKRKHFEIAEIKRKEDVAAEAEAEAVRAQEEREAVYLYEDAEEYFAMDCEMVSKCSLNM